MVASHGQDPDGQLRELIAWNKKFDDGGVILDGDPRRTSDRGQINIPGQTQSPELEKDNKS
jgi:hypothetical protein